jgi:hypothetical protein
MKTENIHIEEFIKILDSFKQKGAITFGMDISDNGKSIVLYPLVPLPSSEESDQISDKENQSPSTSIKDSKV